MNVVKAGRETNDHSSIDRDGTRCAVAAMKGVTIWELASGNRVRPEFLAPGFPSFVRFLNEPGESPLAHI